MNRAVARATFLLACAVAFACDQATAPEGTPSTISVRAYIDADGSGSFNTGDVPIADRDIELSFPQTGGSFAGPFSATTDAGGVATFSDVPPGSYQVEMPVSVWGGAVLTGASRLTVVAPYEGATVATEFRYVYNPGSITGRLFRDNNSNGTWDGGTDTPAPGTDVLLFRGNDTTGTSVSETVTDETGAFSFDVVRPGEHTLLFRPIPTITLAGGNTQSVLVVAELTAAANVQFTGNLIVGIGEARANDPVDSALVGIEGVVSAGTGTFNARSFYVQDATGGILVFGVDTALVKPQPGDTVRVIGRVIAFNDELEIIQPAVTRLGSGAAPAPRSVTGAEINNFDYQGELAHVAGATVVSVGGGTSSGFNVTVEDAAGTQFVVRVANDGIGLPREAWTVGSTYDITGVLNRFRTTAQLAPRSENDAVAQAPPDPIDSVKTRSLGTHVSVAGVVTAGTGPFGTRTFYLQDATGGIMAFFSPSASAVPVSLGDSVRVSGTMNAFGGELEIDTASVTTLKTGAAVPTPRVVTAAEIVARTYEGELVRVNDLEVTSVQGGTGTAFNVDVRDSAGTAFVVRVAGTGTGLTRPDFTVGSRYDLIGVLGSFNGAAQLKPRAAADVIAR